MISLYAGRRNCASRGTGPFFAFQPELPAGEEHRACANHNKTARAPPVNGRDTGRSKMLLPSPEWLNSGDNAWQLAAATFVGLQSIPGLVVLYAGIVKKKWAINSAFMAMYAFAAVLLVWLLWAYSMSFGEQLFPFLGKPKSAAPALFELAPAMIPEAASGMPELTFPMATMVYFQFVFAAITVIILAGSVLGRMSFKAWVLFVPAWMTCVHTIGAFNGSETESFGRGVQILSEQFANWYCLHR